MTSERDKENNADSEREDSPISFRIAEGRISLNNREIGLLLSASNGTLLSLHHRDAEFLDSEDALAHAFLWRLIALSPTGQLLAVNSRECREFNYNLSRQRQERGARLWMEWRGLAGIGDETTLSAVIIQLTIPADSGPILWEEEIELPEGWTPTCFHFPCIASVASPDPLAKEALFFPFSGGILLPDPRTSGFVDEAPAQSVNYPGPASLQLFGYSYEARHTLALSARDPLAKPKTMVATLLPSRRLIFWIEHGLAQRADGRWSSGYPSALSLLEGDWFEAAGEYREWALKQSWAAQGRASERRQPTLTTSPGLWASHCSSPNRSAASARDLQRVVNIPIKFTWLCWHGCARYGAYPDYLPPRGGEQALSAAIGQLHDAGIRKQFPINALLASDSAQSWPAREREESAIRSPASSALKQVSVPRRASLLPMCPGSENWRRKVATLVGEALRRGADGILLEQLTITPPLKCIAAGHGHEHNANHWADNVRALLSAARAAMSPGHHIAVDGPVEPYLDLVDSFFSEHAAAERRLDLPPSFGRQWRPIPLFEAVYHEYINTVGPPSSLVATLPHDPLWSPTAISDLREPRHLFQRDYEAQFCLEVARAIIWGANPLLEDYHSEQTRSDSNRRKLAFLAAALRAKSWGVGALLPNSRFLGELSVTSPSLEIDLLVNHPNSTPSDRRAYRRRIAAVHGSVWRVPGGSLFLVMVNIHVQSVPFTARLQSSRHNPPLPLRLTGRTFSEDGDAPVVSLRASGTEISGKLPARAIMLVSIS